METLDSFAGFFDATEIVKVTIALTLSSFMAITALSFFMFRLKKKEVQYQRSIVTLGLADPQGKPSSDDVRDEYSPSDYWLPVIFATLISLMGFIYLFFGAELIEGQTGHNLLLTDIYEGVTGAELDDFRRQSATILALSFTGAFIWSAQNIIRRLISGDLKPGVYYSTALRIVFASVVALMIGSLIHALPGEQYLQKLVVVIAFLTGMMPEQAFFYLRERVTIFSPNRRTMASSLPLSMIEGINTFHMIRLSETGIDNAQNLAEANLTDLLLKTPYTPGKLIDWIAQAKLYIYFGEDIAGLRAVGIRTVFDFKTSCNDPQQIAQVAKEAKVSELKLRLVHQQVQDDHAIKKLLASKIRLGRPADPAAGPSPGIEHSSAPLVARVRNPPPPASDD